MTETTNHEAVQVIIRCDGCGAPMLTRFAEGEYEFSLYYATLRRTRPLQEGGEIRLPDGTKIPIREAPGFCSQQCFDVVTARPAEFVGWVVDQAGLRWFVDQAGLRTRGWRISSTSRGRFDYDVWWDHRTKINVEPPLAPSVLTKVVTALRERAGLIERKP